MHAAIRNVLLAKQAHRRLDTPRLREADAAVSAEAENIIAEIRAERAAHGGRSRSQRRGSESWRFANSNFGQGF